MKIIQVYAIAMAGFFLVFVIKSFLHVLIIYSIKIRVFLLRHFFYPNLIHRHSLLSLLKRVHALAQLINVAINVFFSELSSVLHLESRYLRRNFFFD